ncbi:MAG: hypothetical protein CENE_02641 [Candidatus Celerinatantimonas neptuna]|nr:MAG: hypothetical protein CENE_02641 [Candidatus Celerinatantimonas neptuna]
MSNFSCYITIINNTKSEMINGKAKESYGEYKSRPSNNLSANGGQTEFRLADKSGPAGSTGDTTYDLYNHTIKFKYDCPWGSSSNQLQADVPDGLKAKIKITYYGKNSEHYITSIPSGKDGQYPSDGHPLSGVFIVEDVPK